MSSPKRISLITSIPIVNGNNAAEGENNIKYASSYPIDLYKTSKAMVMTPMSGVITIRTMLLFERLEKVYVPDEDSLEQRMNIFHGQLYSLYREYRKFHLFLIKVIKSRSDS